MTNAPPSHDAASEGGITGTLKEVYRKFLQGIEDMLPAQVVSYDRATNTAEVRPLIRVLSSSGQLVSRQVVPGVRVFQFGGGGFFMGFNLRPGNLGWIKAADRDISLFLQQFSEAGPNTKRLHSFSDSLFFPDIMRGYSIADEDAGNLVIQNAEGTVRIALWEDRVKITAPTLEVDAESATFSGTLHADGLITSGTDVQSGAVTLKTLRVTDVQSGSGISGAPLQ